MNEIIFDIETLTLDPLEEGARVVSIGVKCGNYNKVLLDVDERELLSKFWDLPFFKSNFRLVGFNIIQFDLPYILTRSFKYGLKVPDFRGKVIDLRFKLSCGLKFKKGKLEDYSSLFMGEEGKKTNNGCNVAELWANQEYHKLQEYCKHDVYLTDKIHSRLKFMGLT